MASAVDGTLCNARRSICLAAADRRRRADCRIRCAEGALGRHRYPRRRACKRAARRRAGRERGPGVLGSRLRHHQPRRRRLLRQPQPLRRPPL